ncbi:MAG: hypothetical protein AAF569_06575 [Pseudomonadota bacterium]
MPGSKGYRKSEKRAKRARSGGIRRAGNVSLREALDEARADEADRNARRVTTHAEIDAKADQLARSLDRQEPPFSALPFLDTTDEELAVHAAQTGDLPKISATYAAAERVLIAAGHKPTGSTVNGTDAFSGVARAPGLTKSGLAKEMRYPIMRVEILGNAGAVRSALTAAARRRGEESVIVGNQRVSAGQTIEINVALSRQEALGLKRMGAHVTNMQGAPVITSRNRALSK